METKKYEEIENFGRAIGCLVEGYKLAYEIRNDIRQDKISEMRKRLADTNKEFKRDSLYDAISKTRLFNRIGKELINEGFLERQVAKEAYISLVKEAAYHSNIAKTALRELRSTPYNTIYSHFVDWFKKVIKPKEEVPELTGQEWEEKKKEMWGNEKCHKNNSQ